MRAVFLCIATFGIYLHSQAQVDNNAFCTNLKKITASIGAKNDWLTKMKGAPVKSEFFLGSNFKSAVTLPGAIISLIHQRNEHSIKDSANYYYNAILKSSTNWETAMADDFNRLKKDLQTCLPGFRVTEDFTSRYAANDAYFTLRKGKTNAELSLYKNSNSNTWVILLSVQLKEEYKAIH